MLPQNRNTIKVSNSLYPEHVRHFVRPDLGPDCLQRLSDVRRRQQLTLEGKEMDYHHVSCATIRLVFVVREITVAEQPTHIQSLISTFVINPSGTL